MIVGNATSYAIYLAIIKPMLTKYHPVTVMKWIFLFGLLMVSGPGFPGFLEVDWGTMPKEIFLSVIFVIIATTFLAYLLNNYSLKYVKPITVSIYIYSQPVIASLVAFFLGQDTIISGQSHIGPAGIYRSIFCKLLQQPDRKQIVLCLILFL